MKNLAILVFTGNIGEFCESGHSFETSYSDDSGESSDSNESGEYFNLVFGRHKYQFKVKGI